MPKLIIHELRKFLRKLYEGYPTHFFFGYENNTELMGGMNILLEDKIIKIYSVKDKVGNDRYGYRLLPEGIKLVENWNVNKLTFWVIILTIGLFVIGALQLILIYLQKPAF